MLATHGATVHRGKVGGARHTQDHLTDQLAWTGRSGAKVSARAEQGWINEVCLSTTRNQSAEDGCGQAVHHSRLVLPEDGDGKAVARLALKAQEKAGGGLGPRGG